MKKVLIFFALLLIANINAQSIINHIATPKNTSGHITTIDNVNTNGKSNAILIVTQNFGVYNNNEIGVWYSAGKWKIFNQNKKSIPNNAKFNVLVMPNTNANAFVHNTNSSNSNAHITTLDSPLINGKPNALVFATQNFGKYNISNVGVWYNGGKWKIYNEDTSKPMPIGTKFNVFVVDQGTNKIGNIELKAFKYKNTSTGHISSINSPSLVPENAKLFTIQNYAGVYNPNVGGVWFDSKKWTIFNQNRQAIPKNVQFNVLSYNAPLLLIIDYSRFAKINVQKRNIILPGFRTRQNISYVVKDNLAIYQGDIVLGSARNVVDPKPNPHPIKRDFSSYSNGAVGSTTQPLVYRVSDGLIDRDWLWPYGIIPYQIGNGFSTSERQAIIDAIQELNRRTNLNLVPHNGQYHFVAFFKDEDLAGSGRSRVGRARIPQRIRLNSNAPKETVIHETLHTAGFWHEQSRSDRDRYIKINWENIADGLESNFDKHTTDGFKITPYDPNSTMHYHGTAFSKNGMPTIVDIRTNNPVSGGSGLTNMDIDGINTLYETDYVSYVTRPITTLRYVKTTILRVESNDRDGGRKTAIDFYMKSETGPGWNWRPGGSSNPTERITSGKVEESDNDIRPNWQFRYAIPRNEEYAKVWLQLRDDDGLSGNERTDEDIDINYFPGVKSIELFIKTSDGQIFLGNIDGVREDINYIGQVGEELEVQGFEGEIKAKVTFKIEIE
tara:strand:- start:189486 stop:191657 length:2172 start_codon:yes stop_codon:yes gene_type:complete